MPDGRQALARRAAERDRFEPAHPRHWMVGMALRVRSQRPRGGAGQACPIPKAGRTHPEALHEVRPVALIPVAAPVDERLEVAIGDFGPIEPVVGEADLTE